MKLDTSVKSFFFPFYPQVRSAALADIIHLHHSEKDEIIKSLDFDPLKLTFSISSEHKTTYKSSDSHSLPSLWKIGKKFSQFSPFDHATWQHPRENPRHVRGSAWIYDVSDCAICSKNREIFPYYGCARILRLTVSVPDYGSWFEVFTLIFLPQLLLLSQSDWLICRCRQGSRQRCPRQCVTPTLSHALPFSSRAQNLLWSNPAEPRQSTTF